MHTSNTIRLTVELPKGDGARANKMRKWLRHIERTGELNVYIESLYVREVETQTRIKASEEALDLLRSQTE